MDDQPCGAVRRDFMLPNANQIRGGVAEKARKLGNAHFVGSSF